MPQASNLLAARREREVSFQGGISSFRVRFGSSEVFGFRFLKYFLLLVFKRGFGGLMDRICWSMRKRTFWPSEKVF